MRHTYSGMGYLTVGGATHPRKTRPSFLPLFQMVAVQPEGKRFFSLSSLESLKNIGNNLLLVFRNIYWKVPDP